jgi:DNA-binding transcriptional LysR family regulator
MPLNLRSLDLNLLPIFAALMREQHLSHAAEQLAMSQPAVSSALKRLRLHFNDELFVRTARGLIPTPRAQELQQAIEPALQLIQTGCSEAKFEAQTSEQSLSIAMNAASEYLIAPKLFQWLQHQAPKMKLEFQPDHLEDIPALLKDGRLDFALDYIGFTSPQIQSQELLEEDLVLICRQHHPQIKGKISLKAFSNLPQVSLVPRSSLTHKQSQLRGTPIEQLMGNQLPQRNICLHVSSFVAIPNIVANSELIAIVPKRIAEHYNQNHSSQTPAIQCNV